MLDLLFSVSVYVACLVIHLSHVCLSVLPTPIYVCVLCLVLDLFSSLVQRSLQRYERSPVSSLILLWKRISSSFAHLQCILIYYCLLEQFQFIHNLKDFIHQIKAFQSMVNPLMNNNKLNQSSQHKSVKLSWSRKIPNTDSWLPDSIIILICVNFMRFCVRCWWASSRFVMQGRLSGTHSHFLSYFPHLCSCSCSPNQIIESIPNQPPFILKTFWSQWHKRLSLKAPWLTEVAGAVRSTNER